MKPITLDDLNPRAKVFHTNLQRRFDLNLDADQTIYFARELELIDRTMYETKYADLEAEMLLPNRKSIPLGADAYTWRMFDSNGEAVPSSSSENAVPLVGESGGEQSDKLQSFALGYGWTLDELDAARFTGMPLDSMRANTTRRKLAEALNKMALLGYAPRAIKGLFNLASTLTYTVPATGTGASKKWTDKTGQQILLDLFSMVDGIPNATLDIEGGANKPLRMIMPKSYRRLLTTVYMTLGGVTTAETILQTFQKQRPNVEIVGANYVDTAGALTPSGTQTAARIVVYDPNMVTWLTCLPFQQMPIEQKGFRFAVPCRCRGGGVITQYPKSVLYADGM